MPGAGGKWKWGMTANGCEASFRGEENVPKLIVVIIVLLCEYPKNQ